METIWSDDQSDRALFKAWKVGINVLRPEFSNTSYRYVRDECMCLYVSSCLTCVAGRAVL
eukprot:scaffold649197_cov53-Prasinocladus_malaysianus.AAC.1